MAVPPVPVTKAEPGRGVRTDIQALRAVAVTMVVAYHLWPHRFSGGLLGVDIFFVISGFLISSGLVAAALNGRLSLVDFWARRARRLLPAALTTIVVTAIAIVTVVPARLWPTFMRDGLAAIAYIENLWLSHLSVDYVGATAEPSPFLHFWSLGVEEQFYVAWPLLMVGAWALGTRWWRRLGGVGTALVVAVACTLASFAYAVAAGRSGSPQPFFDPRSRAWELGVGVVLALVLAQRGSAPRQLPRGVASVVVLVGWAAVLSSVFLIDPATGHPGLRTVVPVAGAALLLAVGRHPLPRSVRALVGLRPVQWVGDSSYSIYLWHWPLIIVLPYAFSLDPRALNALVIVGTLLLAGASVRWVERPFRFGLRRFTTRPRWVLAAVIPAMVIAAALPLAAVSSVERDAARERAVTQELLGDVVAAVHENSGDEDTRPSVPCFGAAAAVWPNDCTPVAIDNYVPATSTAPLDYGPLASVKGCHVENWYTSDFAPCTYVGGDGTGARVAVIGDSHAQQYLPLIGALAAKGNWTVEYTTKGHCPWSAALVDQADREAESACTKWVDQLRNWVQTNDFDLIVTSQKRGEPFIAQGGQDSAATSVDGLVTVWKEAAAQGANVLVIEDNPVSVDDPPACLEQNPGAVSDRCSTAPGSLGFDPQIAAIDAIASPQVALVSFTDAYCATGRCLPLIGHVNVYRNHDHVTGTWAATLTPLLVDRAPEGFLPDGG